jgi:hypothetical protein
LEGLLAALAGSLNTVRIYDWRREFRSGDPRSQGQVPSGPFSFNDATIFTDGTGFVVGSGNPALAAGAHHLLLDNMDPATLREAVEMVAGRVPTEASGGVNLDTIAAKAASGVDYISVGRLTQSAPAADIGLDFKPV